jgi:hypothetical protein
MCQDYGIIEALNKGYLKSLIVYIYLKEDTRNRQAQHTPLEVMLLLIVTGLWRLIHSISTMTAKRRTPKGMSLREWTP